MIKPKTLTRLVTRIIRESYTGQIKKHNTIYIVNDANTKSTYK